MSHTERRARTSRMNCRVMIMEMIVQRSCVEVSTHYDRWSELILCCN